MSNECPPSEAYFVGSLNATVAAVVERVTALNRSAVPLLKFGSMGGSEWLANPASANRLLIQIAAHWAHQGVEILTDQHLNDGGLNLTKSVAQSFVLMQADLQGHGSPMRMYRLQGYVDQSSELTKNSLRV
eukprot:COSAG01_NODE_3664_length_5814_cov_15.571829_9_plen_131_part_00